MAELVQYPGAGCVVEFMQGNAPQIAWVMEEQNGKLRLLLPNRRETSLTATRLLPWAGPRYDTGKSKDAIVALLAQHKDARETLMAEIVPEELWEMAQGEVERASALWLAELAFSHPDVDRVAACAHALLECKSHFKFQPPDFEIYSTETVEQRQEAEKTAREREALVDGGAAWFRLLWDARQNHRPAPTQAAPQEPVASRLRSLLLARIGDPESSLDDHLWRQVSKGLPDDPHLPLLLATSWGLVPEHYNYLLARADYEPDEDWATPYVGEIAAIRAELEARQLADLGSNQEQDARLTAANLLRTPFISIDSATTRDIDDAFYIEPLPQGGWRLEVALACPALNWPFGGSLDGAVAGRGTSLYLPEATYHMMPSSLGTDFFSLHAGQLCPALVIGCQVDSQGHVTMVEPCAAWVNLEANLNFPDAESALDGVGPALAYAPQLAEALALATVRRQCRVDNGAVIIDRPDADFYVVGEGADAQVMYKETRPAPRAQFIVAEIMVLVNAALADWCCERNVPLLFRTQDITLAPECAGIWSRPQDVAKVVKGMAPASLDCTARRHAGMGLNAYATVSSPLRRYPDLVNEAQILQTLATGSPRWTREELSALLLKLNMVLDVVGQVQRFRPRYWKLVYVQQQSRLHGDACLWPAVISEANDTFATVVLEREQLIVRGKRALFPEKIEPGQQVMVRLGKINPLRGDIGIQAVQEVE